MPEKRPRKPAKKLTPKILDPDDPRYIRGIHNYCDRWCERCEFSHRCYNFAMNERYFGDDPEARDMSNQKFWNTLEKIYADAKNTLDQSLKKLAGADGIPSIEAAHAHEKHVERRARAIGQKETKLALTYAHMVDEWFNNELRLPLQHVHDLEHQVATGEVTVAAAKGELVKINDCVEVIRWYQHLIFVKLGRAFSSLVEEQEGPAFPKERDADGTAKVALISIDRSLAAWSALREMFPDKTDSLLEILLNLARMRSGVESKFPKARKFRRAGFDEQR